MGMMGTVTKTWTYFRLEVMGYRSRKHLRKLARHLREWVRTMRFSTTNLPHTGMLGVTRHGEVVIIRDVVRKNIGYLVIGVVIDYPETCRRREGRTVTFIMDMFEDDRKTRKEVT